MEDISNTIKYRTRMTLCGQCPSGISIGLSQSRAVQSYIFDPRSRTRELLELLLKLDEKSFLL